MKKQRSRDIEAVMEMLSRLFQKDQGEDVDTTALGERLRMAVVLVGRRQVIADRGPNLYLSYIKKAYEERKIDRFFLLSAGEKNMSVAENVAEILHESGLYRIVDRYREQDDDGTNKRNAGYIYLKRQCAG